MAKKLKQKFITNVKKLRYFILFFAKVYILKIEKLSLNFFSFNTENNYDFFNLPLDIIVLTYYFKKNK